MKNDGLPAARFNLQLAIADVSQLRALSNVGAGAYNADYLRMVRCERVTPVTHPPLKIRF